MRLLRRRKRKTAILHRCLLRHRGGSRLLRSVLLCHRSLLHGLRRKSLLCHRCLLGYVALLWRIRLLHLTVNLPAVNGVEITTVARLLAGDIQMHRQLLALLNSKLL